MGKSLIIGFCSLFVFLSLVAQPMNPVVVQTITLLPRVEFQGDKVERISYGDTELQVLKHDFGVRAVGDSVFCTFKVKNTGTAPLVFTNVVPDCECTVAYFTEGEILPQQEGVIQTGFSVKQAKKIHHTLTVLSNTESGTDFIELFVEGVENTQP
jgi:hypothetical protein